MSSKIQRVVGIDMAAFTPFGITLIIDSSFDDPLVFPLCEGWVGEFERIQPTSPVFALRRVRPATEQDQRQLVCGQDALWHPPGSPEVDRAISAFLPLAQLTPECEKPAVDGVDHHES